MWYHDIVDVYHHQVQGTCKCDANTYFVLKDVVVPNFRFWRQTVQRYDCPESGKLSHLVKSNSCQCDAKKYVFVERNGRLTILFNLSCWEEGGRFIQSNLRFLFIYMYSGDHANWMGKIDTNDMIKKILVLTCTCSCMG